MVFYGSHISPHMLTTPEGYLICKDVPIGRVGKIKYLDSELGIGSEGRIITVYRTAEENNSKATLASFEGKPVTDGHPDVDVDATNYNIYQKGHIQNVRGNGKYIIGDLYITDETLKNDILNNGKREVSCGYDTIYKQDSNGNLYQTNIRGNHVAVVEEGRAGSIISIRDEKNIIIKRRLQMSKTGQILQDFKSAIKTVKTVDELNDLIDKTEDGLEEALAEEGAQKTEPGLRNPADLKNPPPTEGGVGNEPKPAVDNGMAEIMAAIKQLNAKVDSLVTGQPQSDGTPEGDLDKQIGELQMDEEPDELMKDENPINEDDKGVTSAKAENGLEDVSSVDADAEKNDFTLNEDKTVAKDTAINMLKAVRTAIAEIKDPVEKRKMVDSVLASVKTIYNRKPNPNNLNTVIKAAMKKRDDASQLTNNAQNAYNSMNPHMSKKYGLQK